MVLLFAVSMTEYVAIKEEPEITIDCCYIEHRIATSEDDEYSILILSAK